MTLLDGLLAHFRKVLRKASKEPDLLEFVALIRKNYEAVDLIRAGNTEDGGYLIPNDLGGVTTCFSPGVCTVADFEMWAAESHGIRSFMADASVDAAPVSGPLYDFEPKFLGASSETPFTTLSDWIATKLINDTDSNLLLQMDIEGAEFDVLIETPLDVLSRFRIMIIEFHAMDRVLDRATLPLVRAVFQKIFQNFALVHLHSNNCLPLKRQGRFAIPPVFEATFLRKDRVPPLAAPHGIRLPHPLDETNAPHLPDFTMPDIWWRT